MKTLALLLLLSVSPLIGQTAKVRQLSAEDSAKAKALYAQKADVEKQIKDLYEKVDRVYFVDSQGFRDGAQWGFEYSDDFKFVVPKYQESSGGSTSYWPWSSCLTTGNIIATPAYSYK